VRNANCAEGAAIDRSITSGKKEVLIHDWAALFWARRSGGGEERTANSSGSEKKKGGGEGGRKGHELRVRGKRIDRSRQLKTEGKDRVYAAA